MSGYSGTPLAKKLGIKAESRVATWGNPGHLQALLPELEIVELDDCDVVVGFVQTRAQLGELLETALPQIRTAGGLWVAWPKGASKLPTEINREDVREEGLKTGWVDNKVCAIDADWSGLRFVRRKNDR